MPTVVSDRAAFERDVLLASQQRPVVVDFWAPWCAPCRALGPVLEQLEQEDEGRWSLVKIDVQDHPDLAQPFGVSSIPAVFAFRGGEVVEKFLGNLPPPQIRAWLDKIAPSEIVAALQQGEVARARGDKEAAIASFSRAHRLSPTHPIAILALAELDPARAGELLVSLPERLPPDLERRRDLVRAIHTAANTDEGALRERLARDPADLGARHDLARCRLAAGDRSGACEEMLEILRRDRGYLGGVVGREFLAVLDAAGPKWDKAKDLRQRYAMELFR